MILICVVDNIAMVNCESRYFQNIVKNIIKMIFAKNIGKSENSNRIFMKIHAIFTIKLIQTICIEYVKKTNTFNTTYSTLYY